MGLQGGWGKDSEYKEEEEERIGAYQKSESLQTLNYSRS